MRSVFATCSCLMVVLLISTSAFAKKCLKATNQIVYNRKGQITVLANCPSQAVCNQTLQALRQRRLIFVSSDGNLKRISIINLQSINDQAIGIIKPDGEIDVLQRGKIQVLKIPNNKTCSYFIAVELQ